MPRPVRTIGAALLLVIHFAAEIGSLALPDRAFAKDGGGGGGGGGGGSSGSGHGGGSSGGGSSGGGSSGASGGGDGAGRGGTDGPGNRDANTDDGRRGSDDSGRQGSMTADQDVAREAVMRGGAVPLASVFPTVRARFSGEVLDVRVRRLPSGILVYDVTMLSPEGRYRSVLVDARRNRVIEAGQR